MRHAGKVLTATLDKAEETIKPGMSSFELDEILEAFIRSHPDCVPGFKGMYGFPGTACVSINDEVVHGIPSKERIFKDGDIVGIDCGVLYKKLHTDACRTFMLGEVPHEVSHFVKTTKKALKQTIKLVKPGNQVGDLSAMIQKTLEDQGYSPVIDCTGHGVGYKLHEPPEILNAGQKGTGPHLKPGMTLAIEPISTMGNGKVFTDSDDWTIVSADHSLSAHFEHTVVVTDEGCEVIAA